MDTKKSDTKAEATNNSANSVNSAAPTDNEELKKRRKTVTWIVIIVILLAGYSWVSRTIKIAKITRSTDAAITEINKLADEVEAARNKIPDDDSWDNEYSEFEDEDEFSEEEGLSDLASLYGCDSDMYKTDEEAADDWDAEDICIGEIEEPVCGYMRLVFDNDKERESADTYENACTYCKMFDSDGKTGLRGTTMYELGYTDGECSDSVLNSELNYSSQ